MMLATKGEGKGATGVGEGATRVGDGVLLGVAVGCDCEGDG
jgi:hypothetical protein